MDARRYVVNHETPVSVRCDKTVVFQPFEVLGYFRLIGFDAFCNIANATSAVQLEVFQNFHLVIIGKQLDPVCDHQSIICGQQGFDAVF